MTRNSCLLERIRAKSTEECDCWLWDGSMSVCNIPMIKHNGRAYSARRALAIEMGLDVEGKAATNSCGDPRCVCPGHIRLMTQGALRLRTSKRLKGTASETLRAHKIAATRRRTSKLSIASATAIRAADGTYREIGEEYGVSISTVFAIKSHRMWKDHSNPFAQLMGGL